MAEMDGYCKGEGGVCNVGKAGLGFWSLLKAETGWVADIDDYDF